MDGIVLPLGKHIALAGLALLAASSAVAKKSETVLHTFSDRGDGGFPFSGLVRDAQGNLYGTVDLGGQGTCGAGCGNVFRIAHDGTYQVIYAFKGSLSDGGNPNGAPILDDKGNLYGTTVNGGAAGCGVVYELSRDGGHGRYKETILHDFAVDNADDGCNPYSALLFDRQGYLYGTTNKGGGGGVGGTFCQNGCGAVFQLKPVGRKWKERVLYSFPGGAGNFDGQNPYGALVFDRGGNLWGTTQAGGTGGAFCNPFGAPPGCGTVFELADNGYNKWHEALLYSFQDSTTGWYPYAGLAIDSSDNLYGALVNGADNGLVFKLAPDGHGGVTQSTIYAFAPCDANQGCLDGVHPFGGVTFDNFGNLYGTTVQGGAASFACGETDAQKPVGCGTVFKLAPDGSGGWSETILYRFTGGKDGASPAPDRLAIEPSGNVVGTTPDGGDLDPGDCPGQVGCGVVFRVKP